jgi:hypothetical protein
LVWILSVTRLSLCMSFPADDQNMLGSSFVPRKWLTVKSFCFCPRGERCEALDSAHRIIRVAESTLFCVSQNSNDQILECWGETRDRWHCSEAADDIHQNQNWVDRIAKVGSWNNDLIMI